MTAPESVIYQLRQRETARNSERLYKKQPAHWAALNESFKDALVKAWPALLRLVDAAQWVEQMGYFETEKGDIDPELNRPIDEFLAALVALTSPPEPQTP